MSRRREQHDLERVLELSRAEAREPTRPPSAMAVTQMLAEGGEEAEEAEVETAQETASAKAPPPETASGEPSPLEPSPTEPAPEAAPSDTRTPTSDKSPTKPSSQSPSPSRFYGKPLTALLRDSPVPRTRPSGLSRTSRVPPLHLKRRSPPPKRPKLETKPKAHESDEEPAPAYDDVEDAGFL